MREDTMKGRHPWGWLAALVCALWILPLVAAAATPLAGSEKAAYQRIKQAFDDTGIHFAHRQVTVFVPPGTMGPAAAAAAPADAGAVATEPRAGECLVKLRLGLWSDAAGRWLGRQLELDAPRPRRADVALSDLEAVGLDPVPLAECPSGRLESPLGERRGT